MFGHSSTHLLRRAAAGATGLLVLAAAACTGSGGAPATATGGTAPGTTAATPKVNRLVMAVEIPAKEVNETRHNSTPNGWQLSPMYETLIGLDNNTGKRYPALATEWAIEPDGNGYRFKLRQGVKFHKDNGDFSSKDVVQPWKEILKDDSISGVTEFWRQAIQDIQPVSDNEVVFRFKRPDGNFLDYVSDQLGGYEIWSKKNFDQTGPPTNLTMPALAGTGSYQYKERTQGQFVRFEAVPYQHWRHNPDFKEFEFRWIKEASTRIAALLAGEVHMAALPQDLEAQAERAGMKTFAGKVPGYRVFVQFYCCAMKDRNNDQSGWMEPQGPLADTKVRRALAKAVNLNELNKSFFAGKGAVMYNNPLDASRRGWKEEWKTKFQDEYGFDPEAAKKLLAEAGFGPGNPMKTTMVLSTATGLSASDDIAESVAAYWRGIGVDVALEQLDGPTLTSQTRAYKLLNAARVNGTSSNAWVGITQFGSTAGTPSSAGPQDPKADNLLKQIWTTLDEKKIDDLWTQAGDALYYGHHFVPLFWLPTEINANPQIVADYPFCGCISGSWLHVEYIKAAK